MSAAALQLPFRNLLSSNLCHLELYVHHPPAAELYVLYTSMYVCCMSLSPAVCCFAFAIK